MKPELKLLAKKLAEKRAGHSRYVYEKSMHYATVGLKNAYYQKPFKGFQLYSRKSVWCMWFSPR